MQTRKFIPMLAVMAVSMIAVGCGSSKKDAPKTTSSAAVVAPPTVTPPPPGGGTPPGATGTAPYSFEITKTGTNVYTTSTISTDNILKVKLKVGSYQGNNVHQATWLKTTITVNGHDVVPSYEASNYTYGVVGQTSNVIDFSADLSPGVPVTITVKQPMNDFYCTYWAGYDPNTWQPINPLYNSYPGCLKDVFSSHTWTATLYVQTNSTSAI